MKPYLLAATLLTTYCGCTRDTDHTVHVDRAVVIDDTLLARSVVPDPGAQVCQECHPVEYDLWLASQHANANRLMDPQLDDPAFEPPHREEIGSFVTEIRKAGKQLLISQTAPDGVTSHHEPESVIGVDPLVQYLVPFPGGRLQVVDMSYDPRSNEWFNVYGTEDRLPHEWGFWKNRAMTWNVQCAFCHMTNLEKGYSSETDA